MPDTAPQILIVNLHSALNLGDDAILQVTLEQLRKIYPHAQITLAANHPESWRRFGLTVCGSLTTWLASVQDGRWRLHPNGLFWTPLFLAWACLLYRAFGKKVLPSDAEQARLIAEYYAADLVFSCGGGNFSAHGALRPFFWWALLALAFPAGLGKPVIMLPQSFGPIEGGLQRLAARAVFAKTRVIMAREPLSEQFLRRQLGLQKTVLLFPDLAFGLADVQPQLPHNLETIQGRLKVGVTLMDRGAQTVSFHGQAAYEAAMLGLLRWLIEEKQAHIYLFVQCTGPGRDHDDRAITQRMACALNEHASQITVLQDFHSAPEIKAAYAAMDCVIGTRMHTGILALSAGTPTILIGYQPKTRGVMEALGLQDYYVDMEAVQAAALIDKTTALLAGAEKARQRSAPLLAQYRQQIEGWRSFL